MKALVLLYDTQHYYFYEHPIEAECRDDLFRAIVKEVQLNKKLGDQWVLASGFDFITLAAQSAKPKQQAAINLITILRNCKYYELTLTETNVAKELCKGLSDVNIGIALNCSPSTVNSHNKEIFKKLMVNRRYDAIDKLMADLPAI